MKWSFLFIVAVGLYLSASLVHATTYSVDIFATVPGCGDAYIQTGEECDGINLGGSSCETLGFGSGTLSCSTACTFITGSCVLEESRIGGSSRTYRDSVFVPPTNIIVFGRGAPESSVSLLKDGQRIGTVPVRSDGTFQITVAGLGSGLFYFQLVGVRPGFSPAFSEVFPVRIVTESTSKVGPVSMPPHIVTLTSSTETVRGYTTPFTPVTLVTGDAVRQTLVTDADGFFDFSVDPESLGEFSVVLENNGPRSTALLLPTSIDSLVGPSVPACTLPGDVNQDCEVNLVDFTISRFRYLEELISARFDFNQDGSVTIVDFSIMAFYWTG